MRVTSSRNPDLATSFREAVLQNLPGDGGLFVPAALEPWADAEALLALPWEARCGEILRRLIGDEFTAAEVEAIVREAFGFPVPLAQVDERCHALELFHGPSLAFKDFGARFLAAVLARAEARERTILTATSGDTGAAVAAAFWRRPGFRVVVLYPKGRVSPLQERQLACLGDNVRAFAVEGSFDDCQRLAKACFADAALSEELGLTSANSINLARLLAQTLYYFEAVAQLRRLRPESEAVIAVPSGNFGNLCAGLYARALGLPVKAFIAATNANRTVPDYLDGGHYEPRPSVATLSNAMDVGDPSNWERIAHLHHRDWDALRSALRWGSLDDDGTREALRHLWTSGYEADPHGAVAWGVLQNALEPGETGLFLGTAHPAKFMEVLEALDLRPALPPSLRALLDQPLEVASIPPEIESLKTLLRQLRSSA